MCVPVYGAGGGEGMSDDQTGAPSISKEDLGRCSRGVAFLSPQMWLIASTPGRE